ncbi:MAG: hypothetical protein GXO74_04655 [Calditrichaeota bacterium]|nr:hypothetical protein [Calditrichota bacterium]
MTETQSRQVLFLPTIIFLLLCATVTFSSQGGLVHFPVRNAVENQPIQLSAKIEDPGVTVEYIRIFFRTKGDADYQYIEMDQGVDNWVGEIPAAVVKSPGVEYFILALLTDHSMFKSPESNPYYAPYEVIVSPPQPKPVAAVQREKTSEKVAGSTKIPLQSAGLEVVILSPEPETSVASDDIVIAASVLGNTDTLNTKATTITVDGVDLTASAEISEYVVSVLPGRLSPGAHQVVLQLKDKQGKNLEPVSWRFYVMKKREEQAFVGEKKKAYSGNFYAEYRDEKVIDSTLTTSNIGGSIRGAYGSLRFRGNVFITSRDKPEFQPRNRFFFEAGTKWIGVKLGDTSPRWNELMLWGRRVRGVEAYLRFGFFNFEFAMGQTNRKVEGIGYSDIFDPVPGNPYKFINPATGDTIVSTTGVYHYGTYAQNLIAFRPSFGKGENFQFGINLVKVKDDINSVHNSTQPKDNIVVGPDLLIAFDKHRIELKASAAFSLLANDISTGSISKAEFDTTISEIPFDPADYEKYFVLNTSLIPIDPSKMTSLAYQTSFRFNYFGHNITAIYKSIGSEYNSLANSFLRKDVRGFSLYDRIRLFKNQFYLNLGYENFLEGISAKDDGDPATEPNDYGSFSVGFSYFPSQTFLPRVSMSWKRYDRNNGLDTTVTMSAVNYQNRDISLQIGYDISFLGLAHQLNFSRIANDRMDGFDRRASNLTNNVQMFSLRTNYQVPLTTVLSFATNKNDAGEGLNGFQYQMFGASGIYSLLDGKLKLRAGWSKTSAEGTYLSYVDEMGNPLLQPVEMKYTDYQRSSFKLGGSYKFYQNHEFVWDFNFINFNDKVVGNYKNRLLRVRYQMRY